MQEKVLNNKYKPTRLCKSKTNFQRFQKYLRLIIKINDYNNNIIQ